MESRSASKEASTIFGETPTVNQRFPSPSLLSIKTRVTALMQRCGFAAKGLFVMDGSRRSAHANAYFTGFGAAKRVVFYDTLQRPYSHVGIYLGEGQFVHAPKTGAQVRIESLRSNYWAQRFNGARRIEQGI